MDGLYPSIRVFIQVNTSFINDCPYDPSSIYYLWMPIVALGSIVFLFLVRYFMKRRRVSLAKDSENLMSTNENVSTESQVSTTDEVTITPSPKSFTGLNLEAGLQLLAADERKVIEALLNAGGTMLQKDLPADTGYSRVKIHRILVRLHNRNLVTSEKYYRTKRITLAEWLYDSEATKE